MQPRTQEELDSNLFENTLKNNADAVQKLLLANANPLARDPTQSTALHYAISAEVAEILIEARADLMARDYQDMTPLHIACREGSIGCVKALLKAKVDPLATNEAGFTALYRVKNVEIAQALLAAKANPLAQTVHNQTTLHYLKNADIAQLLLDAKANPLIQDKYGDTPLHTILDAQPVELLIAAKVDPSAKNNSHETPLHCTEDANIIKKLLEAKADVEAKSKAGMTPLHKLAISSEEDEDDPELESAVKLLICAKANLIARCNKNKTPLAYAKNKKIKAEIAYAIRVKSAEKAFLGGFHPRCGAKSVLLRISQSSLFHQFGISMTIFKRLSSYHPSKPVAETSSVDRAIPEPVDRVIPEPGESRKRKLSQ